MDERAEGKKEEVERPAWIEKRGTRMIIDGVEYTVLEFNDDLESRWNDDRPYIQVYYELQDEAEEIFYLTIWSDDNFELADVPISATPFKTGDVSEIKGIN